MTTLLIGHMVECVQCHAVTVVFDSRHAHEALKCACCPVDHNHGDAANECAREHAGVPCSHPDPLACTYLSPAGEQCPGGHCGLGVPGCTVCRPIALYGNAVVRELEG